MKNVYLLSLLICFVLASCSFKQEAENRITVTIEPQRYFVEQLVGGLYEVESMVTPGLSPETYDPTPSQLTQLSRSKAYFCIGHIGFEKAWLGRLKDSNPHLVFYDNSKGIIYETSEFMHGDHYHEGVDPHTWTSPKQALIIVDNMLEALLQIDPLNQKIFETNYMLLRKEIEEADARVQAYLDSISQNAFIIYHPALTYFARDYGLTQYAIEIEGKEPTPAQLKQLIDTAKEKNIKTIFIQEEFDKKNAELIAKETDCKLVVINPLSYNWSKEVIGIAKALSNE